MGRLYRTASILLENLFSYVALPGVVAHELAHLYACKTAGVEVIEYELFRSPETITTAEPTAGRVVHDRSDSRLIEAFIAFAPVAVNCSIAGLAFYLLAVLLAAPIWVWLPPVFVFAVAAFPSPGDLNTANIYLSDRAETVVYLLGGGAAGLVILFAALRT